MLVCEPLEVECQSVGVSYQNVMHGMDLTRFSGHIMLWFQEVEDVVTADLQLTPAGSIFHRPRQVCQPIDLPSRTLIFDGTALESVVVSRLQITKMKAFSRLP